MIIPLAAVAFVFGLFIGSFLNVCIYRMPRNISIVLPSSRCPHCGTPLRPWDNIPLLSYVLLGGRCRYCKAGISMRYPLVEFCNGALYAFAAWRFGPTWSLAVYAALCSALLAITFIDLDFQIIPDRITLPGMVLGLLAGSLLLPDPFMRAEPLGFKSSIIGAAAGLGFFYLVAYLSIRILKKEGMGGGDIKLMAMIGAFLGWKAVILTTFLGSLTGSLAGIVAMLRRGGGRGMQIPFGPFLAFGALATLFFGQELLLWYLY